jgi:hypothetical protein
MLAKYTTASPLNINDPPQYSRAAWSQEQAVGPHALSTPAISVGIFAALVVAYSCWPNWHACSIYVSKIATTHWFTGKKNPTKLN